jgi:hypothetical protein
VQISLAAVYPVGYCLFMTNTPPIVVDFLRYHERARDPRFSSETRRRNLRLAEATFDGMTRRAQSLAMDLFSRAGMQLTDVGEARTMLDNMRKGSR